MKVGRPRNLNNINNRRRTIYFDNDVEESIRQLSLRRGDSKWIHKIINELLRPVIINEKQQLVFNLNELDAKRQKIEDEMTRIAHKIKILRETDTQ